MRPKVVFIAGWGRSGTTLLDQVLGQAPGFFSAGELRSIWMDYTCGCGVRVHRCPFWEPILEQVVARPRGVSFGRLAATQQEHVRATPFRLRRLGRLQRTAERAEEWSDLRAYARTREALYRRAAELAGCEVVIDSSKNPADALLLTRLSGIDVFVIHVVRDPRAAAHSWGKRRLLPDPPARYFQRFGPLHSSLYWLRWNLLIETVVRPAVGADYALVRYEDFARSPEDTVRSICRRLGRDDQGVSFSSGSTLQVEQNHMVDGNPLRFETGELTIGADRAWVRAMAERDRALATAAAAPLMWRYGYRLNDLGER